MAREALDPAKELWPAVRPLRSVDGREPRQSPYRETLLATMHVWADQGTLLEELNETSPAGAKRNSDRHGAGKQAVAESAMGD